MERLVKKYQQKYRRARDELERWDEIQSRLLNQFANATAIIERLQVLQDKNNYGVLKCVECIEKELSGKQMESLEIIFLSMKDSLKDFNSIVKSLEKIWRDGSQLSKGGSTPLTAQQMQLRVGIHPSLADCVEGLRNIHEMHLSDSSEIAAFHQLLADQPNISKEEVQYIFDIIFAVEIC